MQKNCFCEVQTTLNSFMCQVCKKNHHWNCYDYNLTEKQPLNMRCLQCNLVGNNPLMQFEKFVKLSGKCYVAILKQGTAVEKIFNVDLTDCLEAIKSKNIILSIFCTKIKEFKKLYEWPSKNIYIEINHEHHIQYNAFDYAQIPSTLLKGQNVIKLKYGSDLEMSSFFGVVLLRPIKLSELKARIMDVGREKIIETIMEEQKAEYLKKIKSLQSTDDQIQQDTLLTIKLIDGITFQQLEIPVRGKLCLHFDCFELNAYLTMNEKPTEGRWKCPLCSILLPVDQLQIDYIQVNILHEIKKNHPKIYHQLQRVQLNQHLDYTIEDKYLEDEQQFKKQLIHSPTLNKVININTDFYDRQKDVLVKFINEFQRKDNFTTNLLSLQSARKLLSKLHQKDLFKKIEDNITSIVKFFAELFDLKPYYSQNIFEDSIALSYFSQLQDFELVCRTMLKDTQSGLFIYYIRLFKLSESKVYQAMAILCTEMKKTTLEIRNQKMLELILANSYDKDKQKAPGSNFKEISITCKMKLDEYINNVIFLSQTLPDIFFNTDLSGYFIIRNCINISNMIDLSFDEKNYISQIVQLLKQIYGLDICNQNINTKEFLGLILYILNRSKHSLILENKKFENIIEYFEEYGLGDIKTRFQNLDYHGEYNYL